MEALSQREAQLALRNEIENGNIDDFIDSDDFEWNNGKEIVFYPLSLCGFLHQKQSGDNNSLKFYN